MKIKISVIFLIATLSGCKDWGKKPKGDCVAILIDLTDSLESVSELENIDVRKLFKLEENPNTSAYCTIESITEMRYNLSSECTIESQNNFEANSLERKRNRDSFYNSINNGIHKIKSEKVGRNKSFICYSIYQAIKKLSVYNNCDKRIIVISDLMENTPLLSVFNKQQYQSIKNNPQVIYQILDGEYPLTQQENIEINIIHQPTMETDETFYTVSEFFKSYYEQKGIKVNIKSRL